MTDPLVWELFLRIEASGIPIPEIERRAGLTSSHLYRWRAGKTKPTIKAFVAVLGALGLEVKMVRKRRTRPIKTRAGA